MSAWRAMMLVALFFMDVHVRAAEVQKDDCWGKTLPCAVQTASHRREWKAPGFKMILGENSIAEQKDTKTVQLVQGDFYLEVDGNVKFKTPYAEVRCANDCKGIFNRTTQEIAVKSLGGQWVIKRTGEAQEYALHTGLQVKVSEVEDNGMAEMEFPQGLPFSPTVKEWAKFYSGDFKHFKSDVAVFRQQWEGAIDQVSQAQLENATRSIASHQSQLEKERARKRAIEREDAELRKLFREKNNLEP
jgi:hypothetical protein